MCRPARLFPQQRRLAPPPQLRDYAAPLSEPERHLVIDRICARRGALGTAHAPNDDRVLQLGTGRAFICTHEQIVQLRVHGFEEALVLAEGGFHDEAPTGRRAVAVFDAHACLIFWSCGGAVRNSLGTWDRAGYSGTQRASSEWQYSEETQ
ncbi:hypothetical protein BDY21DRAFT_98138 [Lineolata rhizophorae]|uniref:Uncharacterized protein n=1 Tax=Lineolata rhizophorae TaxID=578093 RepID=A0A6A6NRX6_9PEZI|nr:hypothetical protein BDY21DRAFT_98138 [Lineolata rhizophorae]